MKSTRSVVDVVDATNRISTGPAAVPDHDVFELSSDETMRLWEQVVEANGQAPSPDDPVEIASGLVSALPAALLRRIYRYRNYGATHDALLVRNLLPLVPIEPTPVDHDSQEPTTSLIEQCLLAVMWLLGEPYTFASLAGGRLVQNVIPRAGHEQAQTNMGSDSFLDWHVEDSFTDRRCDYFGLLCLRGAAGARTLISAVRNVELTPEAAEVLRQPRFVVPPDVAHGDLTYRLAPVAALTGTDGNLELCYDAVYMRPSDDSDTAAGDSLWQLRTALTRACAAHELRGGELLIVDNRRVVHARTPFTPRYDGADRWLLRTMVSASLPIHRRRGSTRALAV